MNAKPTTIPALREWSGGSGHVRLGRDVRIVLDAAGCRRLRGTARVLADDLRGLGHRRPRVVRRCRPGAAFTARSGPSIHLRLGAQDRELGPEGYSLTIARRRATVRANTPAGVLYGTRTLLQLLRQGPLPAGTARDWPRYPSAA